MSSISASGSDRNQKNEEARRLREEYEAQESEQAKRQRAEIKRLNTNHAQEIEDIRKNYEAQLGSVRNRMREGFTEKDEENQAKIDKLRSLYMDQIKRKVEDNEMRRHEADRTFEASREKQKAIHDQQEQNLKSQFTKTIQDQSQTFEEVSKKAREGLKDSLENRSKKLHDKFSGELQSLVEDRDRRLAEDRRNMDEASRTSKTNLQQAKRSHESEKNRLLSTFEISARETQKLHENEFAGQRQHLKDERIKQQNHFKEATEKKLRSLDDAHESLRKQTTDRVDREVRSADYEVTRMRSDNALQVVNNRRLRDLERESVVRAYEDRIGSLEKKHDSFEKVVNSEARDTVADLNRKNERMLSKTNLDNKLKMNLQETRNKEDRTFETLNHKAALEQTREKTNERVAKILHATNENLKTQEQLSQKNLSVLKEDYVQNLASQRDVQISQLQDQYLLMNKRLQETEKKYDRKLDETVKNYEGKIQMIEGNYQNELEKQQVPFESKSKQREKAIAMEQKNADLKFESKIAQMNEAHDKEIQRLERRHQEQMESLASRVQYYKKKA